MFCHGIHFLNIKILFGLFQTHVHVWCGVNTLVSIRSITHPRCSSFIPLLTWEGGITASKHHSHNEITSYDGLCVIMWWREGKGAPWRERTAEYTLACTNQTPYQLGGGVVGSGFIWNCNICQQIACGCSRMYLLRNMFPLPYIIPVLYATHVCVTHQREEIWKLVFRPVQSAWL